MSRRPGPLAATLLGLVLLGLVLLGLISAGLISTGRGSVAAAEPPAGVRVLASPSQVHTVVGGHFSYQPRIVNPGSRPLDGIVVHLNVASLTSDVYVDPEDWSTNRSAVIGHLNPGGSASLSWDVQAVSAGSFAIYVVLLPAGSAAAGTGPLFVSPPVHVTVTARTTLNASGSLPVVIAVPGLLAVLVAAGRLRARHARR